MLNNKGFTLVELLVVISIIALLTTIGLTVFGNAQRSARDARRRADLDSLSKSLEATRDFAVGTYTYNSTLYGNDYPNNKPADPNGTNQYCIKSGTTLSAIPTPDATTVTAWTGSCPGPTPSVTPCNATTVWCQMTDPSSTGLPASLDQATSLTGVKSWTICAKLEATANGIFCKSSVAR